MILVHRIALRSDGRIIHACILPNLPMGPGIGISREGELHLTGCEAFAFSPPWKVIIEAVEHEPPKALPKVNEEERLRTWLGRIATSAFADRGDGFACLQEMAMEALAGEPADAKIQNLPKTEAQKAAEKGFNG